MFISYSLLAFKHWNIYQYICKSCKLRKAIDEYELSSLIDEDNNKDLTINQVKETYICGGYVEKRLWKRILLPFVVFIVWDMIMGISFFVSTQYPYFMWWEK